MATFSEELFQETFDFEQIESTVTSTLRLVVKGRNWF